MCGETWTLLKVDMMYLKGFEMWCWRRESKVIEKTSKVLNLEYSFVCGETWTLLKVDMMCLKGFEMWCWRRKSKVIEETSKVLNLEYSFVWC